MTEMTRPQFPPCPTCHADVEHIDGFGARAYAMPCGHPVVAIFNAGGVQGAVVLQKPQA